MQTIGERLQEARQRRGVSIREASEATKVRGDYLANMEANQFDAIPLADVYKRGFLKIYARFLRLDADRIVSEYNGLLAARNSAAVRVRRTPDLSDAAGRVTELREPEAPDEFASGAIETAERPDDRRRKTILIAGVISLALVSGLIVTIKGCDDPKPAEAPRAVAAPAPREVAEIRLENAHSAPVAVRLIRKTDGTTVFSRTLAPREIAPIGITQSGLHTLQASPLDQIRFSINGGGAQAFPAGSWTTGDIPVPAR